MEEKGGVLTTNIRLAEELNDFDTVETEDLLFDSLMEGWG